MLLHLRSYRSHHVLGLLDQSEQHRIGLQAGADGGVLVAWGLVTRVHPLDVVQGLGNLGEMRLERHPLRGVSAECRAALQLGVQVVHASAAHTHNSHSQISPHVPRMTTKAITAAISTE
jgi:hypothetical protein